MLIFPTLDTEQDLWSQGYQFVVGLDEAGRGPLAGPMVAGAVIFPPTIRDFCRDAIYRVSNDIKAALPTIIRDSKTLSPKQRGKAYTWILENAYAVGVGRVEHSEIDAVGLTAAEQLVFKRAISHLHITQQFAFSDLRPPTSDFYLVDAFKINDVPSERQRGVIKGDSKVFTIAAASIIAKVTRDKIMSEYAKIFPQYGFDKHVGYGTASHLEALRQFGPCGIHRTTFGPIRRFL